jgi:type VI secretion system protein VasD
MRLSAISALTALLVFSCSSPPPAAAPAAPAAPCVAPRPRVTLAGGTQANAGVDGKGLPVQVRLYQLKSEARLLNAFFEEVWKDDAATLAEDLLAVREFTVFPGKSQEVQLDQLPDGRVLSAVALFREPRGKDWFVNYDLQPAKTEPPCPPAEPRISIWLDRMKIQDGEGRVEATGGAAAGEKGSGTGGGATSGGGK